MKTKYYVDQTGIYLGGFSGYVETLAVFDKKGKQTGTKNRDVSALPPPGAIQVAGPPDHGWQKYDVKGKKWLPLTDEQNKALGLS